MKMTTLLMTMTFALSSQAADLACFAHITKTVDGIEHTTPYKIDIKDIGEPGNRSIGGTLIVDDIRMEVSQYLDHASELQLQIYNKNSKISEARIGQLELDNTILVEGIAGSLKAALSCIGK